MVSQAFFHQQEVFVVLTLLYPIEVNGYHFEFLRDEKSYPGNLSHIPARTRDVFLHSFSVGGVPALLL